LLFDDETTRVYDLRDDKWSAVISNGSGGMGKNVHVEFGATEDEVLVWSDFAACMKVWCLRTGRAIEIRDPKFPGKENRGWAYRPSDSSRHGRGQVMALLCRTSGTDVLLLLSARTYTLISRVELPTIDAANLKWSQDGRWLAVWDAASAGYNLHIYTADGNLYRTITCEPSEQIDAWGIEGLGIKSVSWIPGNEKLAVGGWDRRVRILSTRTFSPVVFLDHTPIIHVPDAPVYTEHIDGQGNRSYMLTSQPVTPPKAPLEKNETALMKQGISLLAFNADGTLCATRDDSTPSTVWIWDLKSLKPRTILIQYAPVKALLWHPNDPSRLLIQGNHDAPAVYLYTASPYLSASRSSSSSTSQSPPAILDLDTHITSPRSANSASARWNVHWLSPSLSSARELRKPIFVFGHQQGHVIVWPEGKDQILRFEREDEEGESDDSLYDILTGRTPVPRLREDIDMEEEIEDDEGHTGEGLDDTFREKRRGNGTSSAAMSLDQRGSERRGGGLDDSGLDEMF
jgi:WD40 repeat protein